MRVLEEGAEVRLPTLPNQTAIHSGKPGGVSKRCSKKLAGTARQVRSAAQENELESGQIGDRRACDSSSVSNVDRLAAASAGWFSPTASGLWAGTLFPVCAEWHTSWMRRFPHRAEPPPPPCPGASMPPSCSASLCLHRFTELLLLFL